MMNGLPLPHEGVQTRWLWLALGCLAQGLVFFLDSLTPLGFAHGALYAPAILLGLIARRFGAIWLLTALGMLGVGLGIWVSNGRLPVISDLYITLNRVLGLAMVLATGGTASWILRLLNHYQDAQQALSKTASLLEVSSAVGSLGGWRVEVQQGTSHWSREVFSLFNQPPGMVPDADTVMQWYVPEHRSRIKAVFDACVKQGIAFDEEFEIITRDGQRRWVRVVGEAVRDASGGIARVQGAIQDISRHKAIQAQLESSRAEWYLMAESLPMIVWVAGSDGLVTYMNQFAVDYTDARNADVLGSEWLWYLHPDDRPAVVERWAAAVDSGQPYEMQFRLRRGDAAWRWHLARAVRMSLPGGRGEYWYGTAVDVQNQRDEQEAHARLASRLTDTMESVTDAIFVLDSDWRFTFINHRALEMLESQRHELLRSNVWEAFPEARGSIFQENYERCANEGVTVRFDAPYSPLGKHFEVNAYPNDGGVVVYFRDVTDTRRIAEQLQQAQRMDSLGQLTGGVAHDFNNLLTVILGNAQALVMRGEPADPNRAMAEMIVAAAKRGAEMTQRLLAFARRQTLEPRAVDLNRLLEQFAPLIQRTLGEHIEISITDVPGLWPVLVDPGQLEAAILNLAVNARDAMPQGGSLRIAVSNGSFDEDYVVQHAELENGDCVMIAVSDSGHGIAPKILHRVFEPFFTTKQVGKGTGLGLAMVYGFVNQSHGHVAIQSEENCGTTVRIYLPRMVRDEVAVDALAVSKDALAGQGQLVLLVEDDELVRNFARRQVESLGYRVIEATNALEALRCLTGRPDIDLLFTDVVMPGGMSGRQLADAAQKIKPGLPVLYTSGYSEDEIVHQGRLDQGVILLSKPYLRLHLAEKLFQALHSGCGNDTA